MGCSLSLFRHAYSPFKRCFSRRRSTDACSSSTSVTTAVSPIYFEGPARRQYFALPDPIIYYIAKNASNADVFRKLVQSCKYFFIKRPLIVISCLHHTKDGWRTCLIDKDGYETFDMQNIQTKMLWLCDNKRGSNCILPEVRHAPTSDFLLTMMIPKLYRFDASSFEFRNITFTFEEILFFGSPNATKLHLYNCIIQYENGESVQLETLLAQFPILGCIWYTCNPDGSDISNNTVKEMLSNPNWSKMKFFHLQVEIPDTFDIESFYTFMKSRDDFYCCLGFRSDIADDYQSNY